MKFKFKNYFLFIVSIVIAIFIAEIGLRFGGLVKPVESGWGWERSPLRHLQPAKAINEVNQLGLRGKRIEYSKDDFVILLLGDSQVEAAAVPFDNMPENVLEAELKKKGRRAKVFSLASSGWGQDQQLIALDRYFENWRADLVLVFATPRNDYWENAFVDRGTTKEAGHIKPTYLLDGELLGPYYESDFYLFDSAILQLAYVAVSGKQPNANVLDRWMATIGKFSSTNVTTEFKCESIEKISMWDFYKNIFELKNDSKYALNSLESIELSRSHFSPFTSPEGAFDRYQRELAKHLYMHIKNKAELNNAKFKVFYPIRNDFDEKNHLIGCVVAGGRVYRFNGDYKGVLSDTVDSADLILIDGHGMNEMVVSKEDRHLNVIGIQRVFSNLSKVVGEME